MNKLFLLIALIVISSGISAQTELVPAKQLTKKELKAIKKKEEEAAKAKAAEATKQVSTEPSIYLESDVVDYGIVAKGGDGTRIVKVYNRGAKPLLISNCGASCGCTVPTCPKEPIMPGQSADITVKYNNTHIVGSFSKSITINSNDPVAGSKAVTIRGEVKDLATPSTVTPDAPAPVQAH